MKAGYLQIGNLALTLLVQPQRCLGYTSSRLLQYRAVNDYAHHRPSQWSPCNLLYDGDASKRP
jgi:hypothetical protein